MRRMLFAVLPILSALALPTAAFADVAPLPKYYRVVEFLENELLLLVLALVIIIIAAAVLVRVLRDRRRKQTGERAETPHGSDKKE